MEQPIPIRPEPVTFESVGIHLNGKRGQIKMLCPRCSNHRRKKREPCLSVNTVEGIWKCHNDDCGWSGSLHSGDDGKDRVYRKAYTPKVYSLPNVRKPEGPESAQLNVDAVKMLKARGISPKTAIDAGVFATRRWFHSFQEERPALCFPLTKSGKIVNAKYRPIDPTGYDPDLKTFAQESNAEPIWYGLDWCKDQPQIVIVEGEFDALAFREAGIDSVMSVPSGSPDTLQKEYTKRFEFFSSGERVLEQAASVIVAIEKDKAGNIMAEELARRIGKEKCFRMDFPDDCKDANDILVKHGKDALIEAIDKSREFPYAGITSALELRDRVLHLKKNGLPEGFTCGISSLDQIFRAVPGQMGFAVGVPSHGKGLALQTKIPTPLGWTTMGEIQVGDKVFGRDGEVYSVTFATEIKHNLDCYRVEFADGSSIVTDSDHLWLTISEDARRSAGRVAMRERLGMNRKNDWRDQSHKRTYPSVVSTPDIRDTLYKRGRLNHQVPGASPLQLPDADLPLSPYVLGCWLGDGTTTSGAISKPEDELFDNIRSEGWKVGETAQERSGTRTVYGLVTKLREIGVLNNKRVPSMYLRGSEQQRRDLLAGLLDTDGSVTPYGRVEFCSTKECLADAVFELATSLGFFPKKLQDRARLNGEDYGPRYRITFTPWGKVFRLSRKQQFVLESPHAKIESRRAIVSVESVPSVPTRCIQVDSPDHLYLCGEGMIPTHNTTVIDTIMLGWAMKHDWVVGIFTPENYPQELYIINLLQKCKRKPIEEFTDTEMDAGMEWLDRHVKIVQPDTPTISEIEDRMDFLVRRDGARALVVDPWTEVETERGFGTEHEFVKSKLTKFRQHARDRDYYLHVNAHPRKIGEQKDSSDGVSRTDKPSAYDIASSSHFANKGDVIMSVWRDPTEDMSPIEVSVIKARFRRNARRGTILLNYHPDGEYLTDGGPADQNPYYE